MDPLPSSTEGRLLLAAFVVLLTLIGLSVLGERTLPLFGGNRDLAGRAYKTLFVGLGGGMLGLAAPALVTGFIGRLRALFTRIEAALAAAPAHGMETERQITRYVHILAAFPADHARREEFAWLGALLDGPGGADARLDQITAALTAATAATRGRAR